MRGKTIVLEDQFLDLGWKYVDAANDHHVVGAAGHLLDPPHRAGGARQQPGEITRAVANDGHALLGERGEHELALGSVRQHRAAFRIDNLRIEMILPDVRTVLAL